VGSRCVISVSSVFLGVVIAFIGFGGFKGAAVVSAFSATAGNANAATRYLFALGRDGFLSRRLAKTRRTQRSPIAALAVLAIPALALSIAFAGTSPANAFNYVAGAAGFLYTFIYLCISTVCIWYFYRQRRYWYSLLAVISGAATGYALWDSLVPPPAYPYNILPYIAVGVVLLGVIIIASSKSLRERLRSGRTFRIAAGQAAAVPAGAAAGPAD
jgi:amino acid transporter